MPCVELSSSLTACSEARAARCTASLIRYASGTPQKWNIGFSDSSGAGALRKIKHRLSCTVKFPYRLNTWKNSGCACDRSTLTCERGYMRRSSTLRTRSTLNGSSSRPPSSTNRTAREPPNNRAHRTAVKAFSSHARRSNPSWTISAASLSPRSVGGFRVASSAGVSMIFAKRPLPS